MIINHHENPFYHITIDEVFSKSFLPLLYKEIDLLKNECNPENTTGSARNITGKKLKSNKGIFLSECSYCENLKILSNIDNFLKKVFYDKNWKNNTFHRMYRSASWCGDLFNLYSFGDYYMPHIDDGLFTSIVFLYENFEDCQKNGGDLYFPEHDYLHECKDNQAIIFFSKELHSVTPIKSKKCKRYSIVSFSTLFEESDKNDIIKKTKHLNYT